MGPQTIIFPVKCAAEYPSLGSLAIDVFNAMGLNWEVVVHPQNHNTILTSGAHPHFSKLHRQHAQLNQKGKRGRCI